MAMLRNSSLNQLKRINAEIKRQGGTTDRTSDSEKNCAKVLWIHDPISADQSGKRKIATYDQMYSIDIPDAPTKVTMKNEKNENKNMKNILSFEKMFENGPNDTPVEINRNMKTIKNWFSEPEYSAKKEMFIGLIGKFIDTGKVKGYINRIEGDNVIIDSIVEPLGLVTIPLKTALKGYKPAKEENKKADFSIQGPNAKSLAGAPKTGGGYSPKLDAKSDVAKDQKISNAINKEKSIKKLADMADDFDGTTIKTKSEPVAPKIDGKGTETKDSKEISKIYKDKKIDKLSDLSEEPKGGKVKGSENKPGKDIDGKGDKTPDNKITTKNTSVKTFSQMLQSDFEGPKSKK